MAEDDGGGGGGFFVAMAFAAAAAASGFFLAAERLKAAMPTPMAVVATASHVTKRYFMRALARLRPAIQQA